MAQQTFEIENGSLKDIDALMEMFTKCTDVMQAQNINQWHYDYPNKEVLQQDSEEDALYVIRANDRAVASITLNEQQDDQYKYVHWRQRNDGVLVIHRLGVHPDFQGNGLAKKLCLFAESFAKRHNYKSIRLDAYAGNPISNRLYEKLGYHKANGYCYFRKLPIPFYCYEKTINFS